MLVTVYAFDDDISPFSRGDKDSSSLFSSLTSSVYPPSRSISLYPSLPHYSDKDSDHDTRHYLRTVAKTGHHFVPSYSRGANRVIPYDVFCKAPEEVFLNVVQPLLHSLSLPEKGKEEAVILIDDEAAEGGGKEERIADHAHGGRSSILEGEIGKEVLLSAFRWLLASSTVRNVSVAVVRVENGGGSVRTELKDVLATTAFTSVLRHVMASSLTGEKCGQQDTLYDGEERISIFGSRYIPVSSLFQVEEMIYYLFSGDLAGGEHLRERKNEAENGEGGGEEEAIIVMIHFSLFPTTITSSFNNKADNGKATLDTHCETYTNSSWRTLYFVWIPSISDPEEEVEVAPTLHPHTHPQPSFPLAVRFTSSSGSRGTRQRLYLQKVAQCLVYPPSCDSVLRQCWRNSMLCGFLKPFLLGQQPGAWIAAIPVSCFSLSWDTPALSPKPMALMHCISQRILLSSLIYACRQGRGSNLPSASFLLFESPLHAWHKVEEKDMWKPVSQGHDTEQKQKGEVIQEQRKVKEVQRLRKSAQYEGKEGKTAGKKATRMIRTDSTSTDTCNCRPTSSSAEWEANQEEVKNEESGSNLGMKMKELPRKTSGCSTGTCMHRVRMSEKWKCKYEEEEGREKEEKKEIKNHRTRMDSRRNSKSPHQHRHCQEEEERKELKDWSQLQSLLSSSSLVRSSQYSSPIRTTVRYLSSSPPTLIRGCIGRGSSSSPPYSLPFFPSLHDSEKKEGEEKNPVSYLDSIRILSQHRRTCLHELQNLLERHNKKARYRDAEEQWLWGCVNTLFLPFSLSPAVSTPTRTSTGCPPFSLSGASRGRRSLARKEEEAAGPEEEKEEQYVTKIMDWKERMCRCPCRKVNTYQRSLGDWGESPCSGANDSSHRSSFRYRSSSRSTFSPFLHSTLLPSSSSSSSPLPVSASETKWRSASSEKWRMKSSPYFRDRFSSLLSSSQPWKRCEEHNNEVCRAGGRTVMRIPTSTSKSRRDRTNALRTRFTPLRWKERRMRSTQDIPLKTDEIMMTKRMIGENISPPSSPCRLHHLWFQRPYSLHWRSSLGSLPSRGESSSAPSRSVLFPFRSSSRNTTIRDKIYSSSPPPFSSSSFSHGTHSSVPPPLTSAVCCHTQSSAHTVKMKSEKEWEPPLSMNHAFHTRILPSAVQDSSLEVSPSRVPTVNTDVLHYSYHPKKHRKEKKWKKVKEDIPLLSSSSTLHPFTPSGKNEIFEVEKEGTQKIQAYEDFLKIKPHFKLKRFY